MLSRTIYYVVLIVTFFYFPSETTAQVCDAEVDGIFFYCRPENPDSFYVGFHIMGAPGTYNVIDLESNNPDNRGLRVDDISSDVEPANYSVTPIMLTMADPNEYWYFGPFENGMSYDIVIVEQANSCDTIQVDSGSYTCVGKPFTGCTSPDSSDVPFYHIIFTNSHLDSCLIIARPRGIGCGNCTGGMGNNSNKACFEFKIELGPNDFGVEVEDVGSGSPAGELYWAFNKDENTCDSLIASNPAGENKSTVCTYDNKVVYMLSCKQGMNATSVSIMDLPTVEAENLMTIEPCDSILRVTGADKVCWTSPDDPNLDNLWNCTVDSLECTFLFNEMVFGSVTQCAGDTFMYIAAASPLDMVCLNPDTIIFDTSYVVVFPVYDVMIEKSCGNPDSVILQANVISAAIGCNYEYEWSNGETTSSISVLADNSIYSVTVRRSELWNNLDSCVNAVAMDSAFIGLDVTCNLDTIRRECTSEIPAPDYAGITVTTCIAYDSMVVDEQISGTGCKLNPLIIYRHFIYSNLNGVDTCTQVIVVEDITAPTFTPLAHMEIPCDGDTSVSSTGMIMNAMDNCTGAGVTIFWQDMIIPGSCPVVDTIFRTWNILDSCGNLVQYIQIITLIDTVAPTFTVPADTTINCELDSLPSRTGEVADTLDNCSPTVTLAFRDSIVIGICPVLDTIFRWWIAIDECENKDSLLQTIIRIDTLAPTFIVPADTSILCQFDSLPATTGLVTDIMDNCDQSPTITFRDEIVTGICPAIDTIYRWWKIEDDCQNMDSARQIIIRIDTIPPRFTAPIDTIINCELDTLPSRTGEILDTTDNCSDNILVSYRDEIVIGICPAIDTIYRWWRVEDDCQNADSVRQIIIRIDTIPPTFNIPGDTIINCDLDSLPARTGEILDTVDNCSVGIVVSYRDEVVPGVCPAIDTIYRWWKVVDRCQNADSLRQKITRIDTVAPTINCPPIMISGCEMVADDLMEIDSFIIAGGSFSDNCGIDSSSFRGILITTATQVIQRYFISDSCGLTDSCEIVGNIIAAEPPVAICRDTLFLDIPILGPALITVDSVDDGSFDMCGIDTMYLSQYEFDCGGIYDSVIIDSVELIVVDDYGLSDTCTTILVLSCGCNPYRPMVCYDELNVSLGMECEREFPLELFVAGYDPECTVVLDGEILDYAKRPIGKIITTEMIGQTLFYKVTNILTNIHCWGILNVHMGSGMPDVMCRDTTIYCISPLPPLPEIGTTCENPLETQIISEQYIPHDCDDGELIGEVIRKIQVKDQWNRVTTCEQVIGLQNLSGLTINCPPNAIISCTAQLPDPETSILVDALWHPYFANVDENGYAHPLPVLDEQGQSIGLVSPPFLISGLDTLYLTEKQGVYCQILANYEDRILPTCGNSYKIKRTWEIADWCAGTDTICVQWIEVIDTVPPRFGEQLPAIIAQISAHDCQASITIRRPGLIDECGAKTSQNQSKVETTTQVSYEVRNPDGTHPNSLEQLYGQLGFGEQANFKLDPGLYFIHYTLQDPCGFSSRDTQMVEVKDNIGPVAICDAITTATADPNECKVRISAKSLDDGSFDNCCDSLHFAVAKMEDIEYWTEYWINAITNQHGPAYFYANQTKIETKIDQWIECYVFNDFVDLTDCGDEMVVLRVYEACGFSSYDPHVFAGSIHHWYCFQIYDEFACHLRLNYDQVTPESIPYADLLLETLACSDDEVVFTPTPNPICCNYVTGEDLQKWADIQVNYPFLVNLSNQRMTFPHNRSQCLVRVLKDDKIAPVVIPSSDLTVYCDGVPKAVGDAFTFPGSCENPTSYPWDGGVNGYYGGPAADSYQNCDSSVWLQSPGNYQWQPDYCRFWLQLDNYDKVEGKPHYEFGVISFSDNCTDRDSLSIRLLDTGSFNECGVGTMQRTWTVTDQCGNEASGTQRITLLPRSDFEVIFPPDIYITCDSVSDLRPEGMGGLPSISDDECELIGITYKDELFQITENACYKIIREWSVVDWCVFDDNLLNRNPDIIVDDRIRASDERSCIIRNLKDNGDGYMKYVQVIKIVDHTAPVLDQVADSVFCNLNENCEPLEIVMPLGRAIDNCTLPEDLWYNYTIYDTSGTILLTGNGEMLRETLPNALYRIRLIVKDHCGNADTSWVGVEVRDCKAPLMFCQNAIITGQLDSSGQYTFPANLFDAGTSDNCTDADKLIWTFSTDSLMLSQTFTCENILNGIFQDIPVYVYAIDEAGNIGTCLVMLRLEDNGLSNLCADISALRELNGKILSEGEEGVENVAIELSNMGTKTTSVAGTYNFEDLSSAQNYVVRPVKDDDYLNGISTLDLVLIQKHILGIQQFNSPYQMIAADVNNSNHLSAIDLVELRKLILGNYEKLPDNQSWRFVDAAYKFAYPTRPWGFPENINIIPDEKSVSLEGNFTGVKIGDVNGSVKASGVLQAEVRENRTKLWFEVFDREIIAGEEFEIEFYAKNFDQVSGFQHTLELSGLEVLGMNSQSLPIDGSNIGWKWIEKGMLTMSWNEVWPVIISDADELFTVKAKARVNGRLSDMMNIHSRYTTAEAYNHDYEIMDVGIRFRNLDGLIEPESIKLFQNKPNPFNAQTVITFELPMATSANLIIYDGLGQKILEYPSDYAKGIHEVTLRSEQFPNSGIYFYQLKTPEYQMMRKMILVR